MPGPGGPERASAAAAARPGHDARPPRDEEQSLILEAAQGLPGRAGPPQDTRPCSANKARLRCWPRVMVTVGRGGVLHSLEQAVRRGGAWCELHGPHTAAVLYALPGHQGCREDLCRITPNLLQGLGILF